MFRSIGIDIFMLYKKFVTRSYILLFLYIIQLTLLFSCETLHILLYILSIYYKYLIAYSLIESVLFISKLNIVLTLFYNSSVSTG
jgi:hypothetical protein